MASKQQRASAGQWEPEDTLTRRGESAWPGAQRRWHV